MPTGRCVNYCVCVLKIPDSSLFVCSRKCSFSCWFCCCRDCSNLISLIFLLCLVMPALLMFVVPFLLLILVVVLVVVATLFIIAEDRAMCSAINFVVVAVVAVMAVRVDEIQNVVLAHELLPAIKSLAFLFYYRSYISAL